MKKFFISTVLLLLLFPLLFVKKVSAASLKITGLGPIDVSGLDLGGSLKNYTYSGGTFELTGLASPSATVSILIDDSTQTATADAEGGWTNLVSSLTEGRHQFNLESGAETLDFVLTIGDSTEATGSTTSTEAIASASDGTLPQAGSTTTTIIFLALAMLSIGLGFALQAKQF
jgi:hypothetical protein